MINDLTFLEDGEYSIRGEFSRRIAERLGQSERMPWGAVSEYVSNMRNYKNVLNKFIPYFHRKNKEKLFRKRTSSQILESGYVTGCTDTGLAFIVLTRELGIPTRYVETFDEQWLQDKNTKKVKGHIFVDIFVGGQWRAYEPKNGFTKDNDYILNGRRYVEVGKGLDFSGVYIHKKEDYNSHPTNLQSLDEAIKIFKPQHYLVNSTPIY